MDSLHNSVTFHPLNLCSLEIYYNLFQMPSVSPNRGRSRSRQFVGQESPSKQHSSPRRSISPRTASRTPPKNGGPHDRRNGLKGRSRSPTRSPSRSRSGGGRARSKRRYRERSYSRSRSRGTLAPKSCKVRWSLEDESKMID